MPVMRRPLSELCFTVCKQSSTLCTRTLKECHDDVIKWKHFPRYWPFVRGIHRSSVNSPHKGQWRGALTFSLISAWINGWVSNRQAGDLRRHRAHYDVTMMMAADAVALCVACTCLQCQRLAQCLPWGRIYNTQASEGDIKCEFILYFIKTVHEWLIIYIYLHLLHNYFSGKL